MLVALDIQHAGKPGRWRDRGVARDGVEEVDLTRRYVAAADRELRRLGHDVVVLSDGRYSDRWKRADDYGAGVYVACHVDAGGGDRGTVFYDYRSTRGAELAEKVAGELGARFPWPMKARACRADDDGEPRDEDYTEPWNTIRGVGAVALCLEPYFLDGPRAAEFIGAVEDVGVRLARGIDAWARAADGRVA